MECEIIRSEYIEESKEKNRLAHQSKHRGNSPKNRHRWAAADVVMKKFNEGKDDIMEFNMNQPTTWKEFKKLSAQTQEEYIKKLQEEYGANAGMLAEMFGLHPQSLRNYVKRTLPGIKFSKGAKSGGKMERWEEFLHPREKVEAPERISEPEEEAAETVADSRSGSTNMRAFYLEFEGLLNAETIYNSLKKMLGDSSEGTINISYTADKAPIY